MTTANVLPAVPRPEPDGDGAPLVFKGLELTGVTTKMIVRFCGVTPGEAADWRSGRARVPWGRVVFLTEVLSHMIEELARTYEQWGEAPKAWHLHMQARIENAGKVLAEQGTINANAPAGALRQGKRFFEEWLERDAAKGWAGEAASRVALGADTTGLAF